MTEEKREQIMGLPDICKPENAGERRQVILGRISQQLFSEVWKALLPEYRDHGMRLGLSMLEEELPRIMSDADSRLMATFVAGWMRDQITEMQEEFEWVLGEIIKSEGLTWEIWDTQLSELRKSLFYGPGEKGVLAQYEHTSDADWEVNKDAMREHKQKEKEED